MILPCVLLSRHLRETGTNRSPHSQSLAPATSSTEPDSGRSTTTTNFFTCGFDIHNSSTNLYTLKGTERPPFRPRCAPLPEQLLHPPFNHLSDPLASSATNGVVVSVPDTYLPQEYAHTPNHTCFQSPSSFSTSIPENTYPVQDRAYRDNSPRACIEATTVKTSRIHCPPSNQYFQHSDSACAVDHTKNYLHLGQEKEAKKNIPNELGRKSISLSTFIPQQPQPSFYTDSQVIHITSCNDNTADTRRLLSPEHRRSLDHSLMSSPKHSAPEVQPEVPSPSVPLDESSLSSSAVAASQRVQLRERTWLRVGPLTPGSTEDDIMTVLRLIGCPELPLDKIIWTLMPRELTSTTLSSNANAPAPHALASTQPDGDEDDRVHDRNSQQSTETSLPPLHVYVRLDVPQMAEVVMSHVREHSLGRENGQDVSWDVQKIPMRDVLRELRTVAVHPDAHRDPSPAVFPLTRLGNCVVLRDHNFTGPIEVLQILSGFRAYALHMENSSQCIVEMEDAIEAIRAQRRGPTLHVDGREVHAELAIESDLRCPRPVLYATVLLSGLPSSTDVPSLVSSVMEGHVPPSPSSSSASLSSAARSTRTSVVSGATSSSGSTFSQRRSSTSASTRPAYTVETILHHTLLHVFLIFSSPSAARQARLAFHAHFASHDAMNSSGVQVVLCSANTPLPLSARRGSQDSTTSSATPADHDGEFPPDARPAAAAPILPTAHQQQFQLPSSTLLRPNHPTSSQRPPHRRNYGRSRATRPASMREPQVTLKRWPSVDDENHPQPSSGPSRPDHQTSTPTDHHRKALAQDGVVRHKVQSQNNQHIYSPSPHQQIKIPSTEGSMMSAAAAHSQSHRQQRYPPPQGAAFLLSPEADHHPPPPPASLAPPTPPHYYTNPQPARPHPSPSLVTTYPPVPLENSSFQPTSHAVVSGNPSLFVHDPYSLN